MRAVSGTPVLLASRDRRMVDRIMRLPRGMLHHQLHMRRLQLHRVAITSQAETIHATVAVAKSSRCVMAARVSQPAVWPAAFYR